MAAKRYLYKIYKPTGAYLGMLPNVTSEFSYSQDINEAGVQLTVQLTATLDDVGATAVVDPILDDTGAAITDNTGQAIYGSFEYQFQKLAIDLNNRINVWLYYPNAVNGKIAFDGYISDWEVDASNGVLTLTVISHAKKLDNYLVTVKTGSLAVSQPLVSLLDQLHTGPPDGAFNYYLAHAQTFQVPVTTISSGIQVRIYRRVGYAGNYTATVTVREGLPDAGGPIVATVTQEIVSFLALRSFSFTSPVTFVAGVVYSFTITNQTLPLSEYFFVGFKDADVYASGQRYYQQSATGWSTNASHDLTFGIIAGTGNLVVPYNSTDPSTILRSVLDGYRQSGGLVSYFSTSIDNTNTVVSYTFKVSTAYEAIRKILELSPGNWYWYVDPGTSLLHFHRIKTTADHTFWKGRHFSELKIKQTMDNIKNTVIFSGGEISPGLNLTRQYSNSASAAKYAPWLEKVNDNRVTDEETASTIARGILNVSSEPTFETQVEIPAAVYDIETILPGQMVAFRGNSNLTDTLLLQIAGFSRNRQFIRLRLATNPPSVSHRVEDIRRNLDNLYTVNAEGS